MAKIRWPTPGFLILTLLYSGCAPRLYTISDLKTNEKLESELLHKKVEVWKHDNQRIVGRLQAIQSDSLVIFRQASRVTIPAAEVRSLVLKDDDPVAGAVLFAVLLSALTLLIISVSAYQVPS